MTNESVTVEVERCALALREAADERAIAAASVIRLSKLAGPGVWREGHPLDKERVKSACDVQSGVYGLRELERFEVAGSA